MAEYLHGAYGQVNIVGNRVSDETDSAMVIVGTAPVNQVAGGAENVNKPIAVYNIAEARAKFGYSSDWEKYTLCEAFHVFFDLNTVGPLVVINVLDPENHKGESGSTTATPSNGKITISDAADIILDSLVVGEYKLGTDYTVAYNYAKEQIIITEVTSGGLGDGEISITYDTVDATKVEDTDVIGATDEAGLNTGLYAIKNVYSEVGMIPSFLIAPGFSGNPDVNKAMVKVANKVSDHWDAFVYADMPLTDGETALTVETAYAWKVKNGYTAENEKVFFPMAEGTDGKYYHLSTIAAAVMMGLLIENDGIPYHSSSNVPVEWVKNLYIGEENEGRVYDDSIINNKLNKNGICSAVYAQGGWRTWGTHCADYDQENADTLNVHETNRLMLYYVENDFQNRHWDDVDQPLSANDLQSIVSEEQARLDALIQIGALTYGTAEIEASSNLRADVLTGDYKFTFNITVQPLAKSLTAVVNWVDDGFEVFYAAFTAAE